MKYVYLVDAQDNCPENNNGSNIKEAYTSEERANVRAKELTKKDGWNHFIVLKIALDVTEDEYLDLEYGDKKETFTIRDF